MNLDALETACNAHPAHTTGICRATGGHYQDPILATDIERCERRNFNGQLISRFDTESIEIAEVGDAAYYVDENTTVTVNGSDRPHPLSDDLYCAHVDALLHQASVQRAGK